MRGPVVLALLAGGLAASACLPGNEQARAGDDATPRSTATAATPLPEPTAPATPDLPAVAGERRPAAHWVDASGLLTQQAAPAGDPDTVLPFVHAVGDWLDAHLDDLQRGGAGRLADVAPPPLLAAATPADLEAVTTALASPDAPVASATYGLDAAYGHEVEWLTATVSVTTTAGTTASATLVFVPTSAGPELVLLGPADDADGPHAGADHAGEPA